MVILTNQEILPEHEQLLKDFLELSDFVKFAKYLPNNDENNNIIVAAKRFVNETMVVYEEDRIEVSEEELQVE